MRILNRKAHQEDIQLARTCTLAITITTPIDTVIKLSMSTRIIRVPIGR